MLPPFCFRDGDIDVAFSLPIYIGIMGFLVGDLLLFSHLLEGEIEEVRPIVFLVGVPPGKIIIVLP